MTKHPQVLADLGEFGEEYVDEELKDIIEILNQNYFPSISRQNNGKISIAFWDYNSFHNFMQKVLTFRNKNFDEVKFDTLWEFLHKDYIKITVSTDDSSSKEDGEVYTTNGYLDVCVSIRFPKEHFEEFERLLNETLTLETTN